MLYAILAFDSTRTRTRTGTVYCKYPHRTVWYFQILSISFVRILRVITTNEPTNIIIVCECTHSIYHYYSFNWTRLCWYNSSIAIRKCFFVLPYFLRTTPVDFREDEEGDDNDDELECVWFFLDRRKISSLIFKSFLYLVIDAAVGTDTDIEEGHEDEDIGGMLLLFLLLLLVSDVADDVTGFPSPDRPNADDLPPLFCC
mmetsp:Transcript_14385/g.30551  ORF Transcript_14385/g.30551 Transcript_14385/m.30551 type:complete len:200 (-) Transcript_14385:2335-2934(-)